jgi:hypothetical protein
VVDLIFRDHNCSWNAFSLVGGSGAPVPGVVWTRRVMVSIDLSFQDISVS